MSELKPLVCTQCGGTINRATYTCEYCGTKFKEDSPNIVHMVSIRQDVKVIQSQRILDDEMIHVMGSKDASEYVLKQMAAEMAEILIPMMDVKVCRDELDFIRNTHTVKARLRVVEPTYTY